MTKSTNDYGLGDVLKKATTMLGIKPCSGCERRAQMLNDWSRRSFLWRGMMSLAVLKTSFLSKLITSAEADVMNALDLARAYNVTQLSFQIFSPHAADDPHIELYATSIEQLLGPDKPGLAWLIQSEQGKADTANGAFLRSLRSTDPNREILSGWISDFSLFPDRYVIVISQKVDSNNLGATREVVITDETGLICRARINGPDQPAAKDLKRGIDFPGAVPFNLFSSYNSKSRVGKAGYIFSAVAYRIRAQLGMCELVHSQCY